MPRYLLICLLLLALLLAAAPSGSAASTALAQTEAQPYFWVPRHPPALAEAIGGFEFVRPSAASLALDPANGARLWAAMTSSATLGAPAAGLYTSADGGLTWSRPVTQPLDFDAPSPLLTISPTDPDLLLASFDRGARDGVGGLQRSADGGLTWAVPVTDTRATSIAWAADGQTVYAATIGVAGNPLGGPQRSADAGRTWARLPAPANGQQSLVPKIFAVDPANAAHVWTIAGGGLFESADGGQSWTMRLAPSFSLKTVALHPATPGLLLAGGEDGLRRSTDGGLTWSAIALPPTGYGAAVDLVAWSPADALTAYAVRRSAQLWRSLDGGLTWQAHRQGLPAAIARDPVAIVFDPVDAGRVFISLAYDRIYTTIPRNDQQWLPLAGR